MIYRGTHNAAIYVDVTKAPYFADPTGETDATDAICRALDDVLIREIEGVERERKKLEDDPRDNFRDGFENRKTNGVVTVIFPEDPPPARILYFPEGVYRISDTLTYSFENLKNIVGGRYVSDLNRFIRFQGAGRDKTVIRLSDHLRAFRYGENKPMVSFTRSNGSNVAMMNSFEDITLDTGVGNSGAVGLRFHSNNTGHVRNVTIRTSDPDYRGYAALLTDLTQENIVENVDVVGFEYGIKSTSPAVIQVFENIRMTHIQRTAVHLTGANVTIRGLHAETCGAGVWATDNGLTVITDATLIRTGAAGGTAIRVYTGHAYLRRITTEGFGESVVKGYTCEIKENGIFDKWCTDPACRLFPGAPSGFDLPVPPVPEWTWSGKRSDVAEVDDFGAVGDGVTDSTDAIRRAFASGKPYVVFGEGRYLVSGEIPVPGTVEAVNFMYCDFAVTPRFAEEKEQGLFAITEDSDRPLHLEDAFVFEKFYGYLRFIRHSARRDLVVSDIHVQTGAFYFNTVGGSRVFLTNVASTMGVFGGVGYGSVPCFRFSGGQQVWARQFNPERSADNCLVEGGSTLWVLGFKTEGPAGRAFTVRGGSRVELLGGAATIATDDGTPCIENEESSVFAVLLTDGCGPNHQFTVAVRETQNGETRELPASAMPPRSVEYYFIPGYIGLHHEA